MALDVKRPRLNEEQIGRGMPSDKIVGYWLLTREHD